jgi:hypothetical protein
MMNGTDMAKLTKRAASRHGKTSRRSTSHGGGPRENERGSSLILALIYIVAISMIVGALADWAMNDLSNTTHFQNATSLDNAVSGATEVAIQSIRYYPNYAATSPGYGNCWTPPSGSFASDVLFSADNNATVAVWCNTVENLKSPSTRVVTFIACPVTAAWPVDTAAHALTSEGHCTSQPKLLAVVTIDDYPSGGGGLLTQTCSGGQGVCGFAATTNQWTWS